MRVWVFRRLRILEGRQGFADLEDHLAARLIASGHAAPQFDPALALDPDHAPFADEDGTPPPKRKPSSKRTGHQKKKARR